MARKRKDRIYSASKFDIRLRLIWLNPSLLWLQNNFFKAYLGYHTKGTRAQRVEGYWGNFWRYLFSRDRLVSTSSAFARGGQMLWEKKRNK